MHEIQPFGQLVSVGNGGGESNELDFWGAIYDGLFPNRAPLSVIHVVALIQHYGFNADQRGADFSNGCAIEHVAEDFGGHHQDWGIPVDGDITGEKTDLLCAKQLSKITQLLV